MSTYSSRPSSNAAPSVVLGRGTKDGVGSADNDQPYTFGRRPRTAAPFPFLPRQYARLLALRGRVADGLFAADDLAADPSDAVADPTAAVADRSDAPDMAEVAD
jgi:hypothetical protein